MAIKQIVPVSIVLQGDGSSTIFTYALDALYCAGFQGSIAFGSGGVVPSSIVINNPPVAVTSSTIDANGNITITLTTALGNGIAQTFEIDLIYNSGAAVSNSPNPSVSSLSLAQVNSSAPTYINNQTAPLTVDLSGNLRVVGGATPDVTNTALLGALNAAATVNAAGYNSVGVSFNTGTLNGTITPQASMDGGSNWVNTYFDDPATSTLSSTLVLTGANGPLARSIVGVAGASNYRVTVTAYTSGSTLASLRGNFISDPSTFFSGLTGATTLPLGVAQMGASVSISAPTYTTGTLNALSMDTGGSLRVNVQNTPSVNINSANFAVFPATNIGVIAGAANVMGSVTTSAPSYTTGQVNLLSLDTAGNLRVLTATESSTGSAVPAVAEYEGINVGGTLRGVTGVSLSGGTIFAQQIDHASVNGVILGSPSNYGTSPGAVTVPGVNAFVTNTVTVSGAVTVSSGAITVGGTVTSASTATGTFPILAMGGVVTTANPSYSNNTFNSLSLDANGSLRVVSESSTPNDLVGTGVALNALNTVALINAAGYSKVGMFLAAGTLAGTIVVESSLDGGTTWVATYFNDPTTSATTASLVFTNPNAATSKSIVGVAGASNYRVRVSAFTSGTATCTLRANEVGDPSTLTSGAIASTTQPPLTSLNGGWVTNSIVGYTTATLNALSLTTSGTLRVDLTTLGGNQLGTPTNFGTSPGATPVLAANVSLFQGSTAISTANPTFASITDGTTKATVIVATAALKTDLSSVAGTATVTAAAGVQKVGIVGNAGAVVDAVINTGAAPANVVWCTHAPSTQAASALSAIVKSAQATAVNIKASAGNLYGFAIVSATATAGFIMFFNTATTATTGAVYAIPIAASGTVIVTPGAFPLLNFSAGIAINVANPINGTTTQISWTGTISFA